MDKIKKIVHKAKCLKCGRIWFPRYANPKVCPDCKSYRWKEPRAEQRAA